MTTFVFFHVGPDILPPTILVRSLRQQHPGATIIQCSDVGSPEIEGVSEIRRTDTKIEKPILFRVKCFAKVEHSEPTVFMDTDMICVRKINPVVALDGADVAVCRRDYEINGLFNTSSWIELPEYKGMTLGELYPYVACVSVTSNPQFWNDCLARYLELPEKFHKWFGDQEVIRDLIKSQKYTVKGLPERLYARLLDFDKDIEDSYILHFKGKTRKFWMKNAAKHLGLMTKEEYQNAA